MITFHSLEDRIVKTMFKEYSTVQDLPPGIPVVPEEFQPELKVLLENQFYQVTVSYLRIIVHEVRSYALPKNKI